MSITLEFPWTQERYVHAGQVAYKYQMAYSYKKYIGLFFMAIILIGLVTNVFSILYLGLIFTIYWYYIRPLLQKSRLKKAFKKESLPGLQIEFVINHKGIAINKNLIPWNHIRLLIIHEDGFLLERQEGYPFLPLNAFKSDADAKKFLTLIDENNIAIKNIS